jgi:hypothetical protein
MVQGVGIEVFAIAIFAIEIIAIAKIANIERKNIYILTTFVYICNRVDTFAERWYSASTVMVELKSQCTRSPSSPHMMNNCCRKVAVCF